jgi:tetraacyldisaccharide 4'-kinase
MSGEARDAGAAMTRAGLRIVEPFYSSVTRIRNAMYGAGVKRVHRLPRPVISIGNITTGGTGKTPIVQWIARHLLTAGHRPACLLRGYKVGSSTTSDEATLLEDSLQIPVRANPDRVAAGNQLIVEHPEIDVILLDDGFQHRRLHRDLNIVLIDATNPFGYGHVLPRGMLREPLMGLARASVFIVTRANLVDSARVDEITSTLRHHNPAAPVFYARQHLDPFVHAGDSLTVEPLRGKRVFSFCGIGNPASFLHDLLAAGAIDAGHRWFPDHHDYSQRDIEDLASLFRESGAELIVATEKDWVKIEALSLKAPIEIWWATMKMEFDDASAGDLMSRITATLSSAGSSQESAAKPAPGAQTTR